MVCVLGGFYLRVGGADLSLSHGVEDKNVELSGEVGEWSDVLG